MGIPKERKKKSKETYELQRRQLELEEQLLDIQQRRLELEQARVELELKKVKLEVRRPKQVRTIELVDSSLGNEGSDDGDSSYLTAPTVASTQHYYSDNSAELAAWYPSQRFCGYESEEEDSVDCSPKSESKPRLADLKLSSSAMPKVKPENLTRSSSENPTSSTQARGRKLQSSSTRVVRSMSNLVDKKQSLEVTGNSESLRDLLLDKHADVVTMLYDSCNRSTETFNSGQTKVTSNVSDDKTEMIQGNTFPSLSHHQSESLSTFDVHNGEFVCVWPDGRRYQGSWKDGKFHGPGLHTWPNGGKYVGQYKNGLKWGYGVYHWAEGSKYEGYFAKGKRNGSGCQLNADGSVYHDGLWKDDEPVRA